MELDPSELKSFVRESNRIEGITRAPSAKEIGAHIRFLDLDVVQQSDLEAFVAAVAPGKPIRDRVGMNVRVGHHCPPGGGRNILEGLYHILWRANGRGRSPYLVHQAYEALHPFMDGNGRSGRALWLWMMLRSGHDPYVMRRGFLHTWYYQSLAEDRP